MARSSLFKEFIEFLSENKKWWLLPIFIIFGIFGLLLIIAQAVPASTPFIYTLF